MSEVTFKKQMISRLDRVEKTMNQILEYIEVTKLTVGERRLLRESYRHEKEGKLISGSYLKKKLGI